MAKIVFIMTDTQRHDMLSCYADTGLKTPNLDKLASGGIRFDKAYTVQPVCQPARAALFTGMYPSTCGSWTNSQGISDNVHTIGQRLRDKGIQTAYIGKWHLDGGDYFGLGKCPDGWNPDYWYDMRNFLEELIPEERYNSRQTSLIEEPGFPAEFTYAHKCSNKAISFLENHGDDDFLLCLSYDEPHGPSVCPVEFYKQYVINRKMINNIYIAKID